MTAIDLHPEELLEKELDQVLTPTERVFLDAHLRACSVCRLLRQARNDFNLERASWQPSQCQTSLLASSLMKKLEQQARSNQAHLRTQAKTGERSGRFRIGRRARNLAAALMVIGSAAAASGWWATGQLGIHRAHGEAPVAVAPRGGPRIRESHAQPAPQCVTAVPEVASAQTPLPSPPAAESVRAVAASARPTSVHAHGERDGRAAAMLFDRATAARLTGDYSEALRLYRELERRTPTSSEARASRASVARLLLDMGQPEAALSDLGKYLAQHPAALAEEALVDRALAYQKMGRTAEERGAWQALLDEHPGSLHATRARTRVNELDALARE